MLRNTQPDALPLQSSSFPATVTAATLAAAFTTTTISAAALATTTVSTAALAATVAVLDLRAL